MKYPTKLSEIGIFVKYMSKKLGKNLLFVILSGSYSYNDAKEGWSDIDLTFIIKDRNKQVFTKDCKVNFDTYLTYNKYKEECKKKSIYAYILNHGKIIYYNGVYKLSKPQIPNHIYSGVALQNCFVAFRRRTLYDNYIAKTRQLYHSLRHYIRYRSLIEYNTFPLEDIDITCYVYSQSYDKKNKELVSLLYDLLKCKWELKVNNYEDLEYRTFKFLSSNLFGVENENCSIW